MPKSQKSPLQFFMSDYPALPAGRWLDLKLVNALPGNGLLTLFFEVLGRPDQLGRQVEYDLPALLAPASPLASWLSAALNIHLRKGESIDLAEVTGRVTQAQFAKAAGPDQAQQITAWRPVPATTTATPALPSPESASGPPDSPASAPSSTPATTAGTPVATARTAGAAAPNTGATPEKGMTHD